MEIVRLKTALLVLLISLSTVAYGQSINSGTLTGTVVDPSGAVIPQAKVTLRNPVSGFNRYVTTDTSGAYKFNNVPFASYHLDATAPDFGIGHQEVDVRNSNVLNINLTLPIATAGTSVTVEAAAVAVENDSSTHTDLDQSLISKLPVSNPGAGLSGIITYSTGAVAGDSNGSFHPLGDHAQVSFVIDGQHIGDQQSKVFSTQLPASAVQSMEVITSGAGAEYGDKTSLVAQVTTKSGLGAGRVFGSVETQYGSFGTAGSNIGLGYGNEHFGNFLAIDGLRSGRFLDSPEFTPFHDIGNNETIFDRFDFQPGPKDVFHLNLFAARNWIQIPNTYDSLQQDQRQRVLTWSIAPGYQHTVSPKTLLTINPYIRKDQFNYYPSRNPFADTPASQTQTRQLLNWGATADISTISGRHNLKYGIDAKQTRLLENFAFGITDPSFNSPCIDSGFNAVPNPALTNPSQCAAAGYQPNVSSNPNAAAPFSQAILLYDLSRGGRPLNFHSTGNINQFAAYFQDGITFGNLLVNVGFRYDYYDGLVTKTQPQPRIGLSYNLKNTRTVLRASYSRSMETPFNENLLLSSSTGVGGLGQNAFGSNSVAIQPGFRNQFDAGLQQGITRWVLLDLDYFWKYTHNAFDFSTLLNTTITFPIAWHNSKVDGVTGRVATTNIHGFQAYWTFGHTRARYFPPETGGLIPQGAPIANGVFRIDHDQAFQSTLNLRYQRPKNEEWIVFTDRYDSGLVVSGIPDAAFAITNLTPNQQVSIGLACAGVPATGNNPITACGGTVTSKLLTLPPAGTGNADHNPDRVQPRNIFNVGIGSDNLLHWEGHRRVTASLEVENLTNKTALYNFLSTFSGTHFIQPRTIIAKIGFVF